ncbi:MAG: acyltransferase family protein [Bacteroidales bacterium]
MSAKKSSDRIYFPYLDVIRFVAAFMIIVYHGYEAWRSWFGEVGFLSAGTYTELTGFGKLVNRFLGNLELGVDIFFLLSGFLITYILLKEKEKHGKINIKNFIIRRTLRIWPLYFLLIAIAPFLVSWLNVAEPNYLANALFVNNFHAIQTGKWTYPFAHFWSICIEEHFYLVWPFIIAFVPRRYLLKLFVSLILVSIAFRMYASINMEYPWFAIYLHTLSRMDVLIIGSAGALFYARRPFTINLSRFYRYALMIILIAALALEPVVRWDTIFLAGFKKFFYTGIIAVLLLDYNFNPKFRHIVKHNSIFHYFGKISYGIYMYGNILLLIVMKKMMMKWGIDNMYIYMLLLVSLSLIIPAISYELFEKPILRFKRRFAVIKTRQEFDRKETKK